jgi:hypothetical protein
MWWGSDGDYWQGREIHIPLFIEFHTKNDLFKVYGGPGLIITSCRYSYSRDRFVDVENSINWGIGIQGGVEFRFGLFLIGSDMRLVLYALDTDGGTVGNGATGTIGVRTGVAF